jgi:hypothetical protein
MFTIEAWVKYDVGDPALDTTLGTIFGKFTAANNFNVNLRSMKVGFALANSFMRVYVGNLYYDFDYPFLANYKWQHISVSYDLVYGFASSNSQRATNITVYIDG